LSIRPSAGRYTYRIEVSLRRAAGETKARRIYMKKPRSRTLACLLLVLIVPLVTTAGCGSTAEAPIIPPPETFVIPFGDFQNMGAHEVSSFASNQSSFNFAALSVGVWSAFIAIGLAVPVAAFQASFHNIPLHQDDGSWVWSYSVNVGGSIYTAELHAQFDTEVLPEGIYWSMNISKQGEYEDFLWYYGESDVPATEGFWILKKSPADPTDLLQIDWSRNISAETYGVKYTNIVPDGPENGGYIDTQYTGGVPYDHIWDIYNKGQDNHTLIQWSQTTGEGRVKDSNQIGDDDWHCWNTGRTNVTCPSS
jgi:hypothetical protein